MRPNNLVEIALSGSDLVDATVILVIRRKKSYGNFSA